MVYTPRKDHFFRFSTSSAYQLPDAVVITCRSLSTSLMVVERKQMLVNTNLIDVHPLRQLPPFARLESTLDDIWDSVCPALLLDNRSKGNHHLCADWSAQMRAQSVICNCSLTDHASRTSFKAGKDFGKSTAQGIYDTGWVSGSSRAGFLVPRECFTIVILVRG
ncbi:uncharacterized protein LACBIDRAFT_336293 [Laccaria bicolor S238N-H82]|uniref:Predicted protein n=1 Tax=Laccaria bicolor (strain S238N-H82 / ATCC MYA-4686) TaxID=486041 RepID=B0E506_LACBS|nr:uncharacterized protein LACBIDRAFT_336293 [Laccaria bicolor S238N-H82]EDQ98074.1 predicted protein [Laccaria bicolor S238N-H82]|eukprot:XP_001891274.1 predicted protein [Laccaria bicolor S238N-H82]